MDALIAWFAAYGVPMARIGLQAGPLSQRLYTAMSDSDLAVELLETRYVCDSFKLMPVKTDRKDARVIAQLTRLLVCRCTVGRFHPIANFRYRRTCLSIR